jgi:hypothetical protein
MSFDPFHVDVRRVRQGSCRPRDCRPKVRHFGGEGEYCGKRPVVDGEAGELVLGNQDEKCCLGRAQNGTLRA